MLNRSSNRPKRSRDPNVLGRRIVQAATGQALPAPDEPKTPEQLAAALLGRRGGLKGGKARAARLSARKRKQIAKAAAKARWGRTRKA